MPSPALVRARRGLFTPRRGPALNVSFRSVVKGSRHLWTGCPVCGERAGSPQPRWTGCPVCGKRAGSPQPPGESRNPLVIYGQDVLYAARGQEARSRQAKAGIQWFIQSIPAWAGMPIYKASCQSSAGRRAPESVYHPAIVLLDSGVRRNDDEAAGADRQTCHLNPCPRHAIKWRRHP